MRLGVLIGFAIGFALAACGDNARPPAVPLVSGPASLTLSDDGTALVFARGDRTLLTLHGDAFAVGTVDDLESGASFDPYWLYLDGTPMPDGFAWREQDASAAFRVVRSSARELVLAIDLDGASATVTLSPAMEGGFVARTTGTGSAGDAAFVRLRADAAADEGFYGLGEWGDSVMHRGKLRPMQMEVDTESESSDNENHVPVPLLIGTRGWGLFAKSDRPGVFDVARHSDTRIEVAYGTGATTTSHGLEWYLFSADQPIDVLHSYFTVTGTPGLPAEWAYGPLLWRNENADQAQVLDDIQQIRTRELPTSGIWFDRPYATGVQTFDWDASKFPDPPAMLQALHDAGLRYAIWQAPYTAPADSDSDPAGESFAVADAMGFFPPKVGVALNPWSDPIDFTNPAAYAWWQDNLRRYTTPLESGGFGVEGFKLDYAEDVMVGVFGNRTPWSFADGSDELTMHYGYTMLYHQIHREVLPAEGGLLLTRTGRWGDQTRGPIVWPGDLDASFARQGDELDGRKAVGGLPTALSFGLGLSASGFPFSASDTGGYRHSPADPECWIRWVEANAVWSAMQVGDATGDQPWEFTQANGRDDTTLAIYKRYAQLHLQLFPYAWTYAHAIAETGRPIVRPLGLAYPELGVHPDDEYLFGDSILVAPVIAAGVTEREVAFPPGRWISWWDGTVYEGGTTHTVPAPLDTLPLFVAEGAIVPMLRDTAQTLAPVAANSSIDSAGSDPGRLTVRVVPSEQETSFLAFDGKLLVQRGGTGLTLGTTTSGRFRGAPLWEVLTIATAPSKLSQGGVVLTPRASVPDLVAAGEGWFWEPATGGTLWVIPPSSVRITVE